MTVNDLEAAVTFWESLGLEAQWRTEGTRIAVGMGAGSLQLMLLQSRTGEDVVPQSVYLTVSGVDVLHAKFSAEHPDRTGPIGDREYGMRDFSVIDPWQHMVVFGEACSGPTPP
jgi:predicted lactoylglutathione lyase